MDLQKEKEELIEMFGVHFETLYHLPPLASRILGHLIVDESVNGFTFEQLVALTGASKSSVSTNIKLLLQLRKITYFTLPGDRKKYFKPSPFSERLDNYQRLIGFEKKLIDRMLSYSQRMQKESGFNANIENVKAYKEHVIEVESLLAKTILKFKQIEEQNKQKRT